MTPGSAAVPSTRSADVSIGESVCVGDFQIKGLESQCYVVGAMVSVEMERLEEVLTQLETWAEEMGKDGESEGKLGGLIIKALRESLAANGRAVTVTSDRSK